MAKIKKRGRKTPPQARRKALAPGKTSARHKSGDATLKQQLAESRAQQAATAAILKVISRSPDDVQPVFDAIAKNAMRLLRAWSVVVVRFDGELLHFGAARGALPDTERQVRQSFPAALREYNRFGGRAITQRSAQQIPDCLADADPQVRKVARLRGFRASLSVPILRAGKPLGSITVARAEPGAFPKSEVDLLRAFADQAVIAIENVRLFNETKEALERQTATAEILKVIAGSPADVQPVFEAIAERAATLGAAKFAYVTAFDGEWVHLRATHGPGADEHRAHYPLRPGGDSVAARVVRDRAPVQIEDVLADPEYKHKDAAHDTGFRSAFGVPMLLDGRILGAISLARPETGAIPDKLLSLLQTFADQAVIAIENVRLFNETKEALERQTATADILRVISGSPTDTQPVFEVILDRATKLCDAQTGILFRYADGAYEALATRISNPEFAEMFKAPRRPEPGSKTGLGRLIREKRTVHIHDLLQDADTAAGDPMRLQTLRGGVRTWLGVPLLKDGEMIGAILVYRSEPRPFAEQQISLLETFADQAVIAIENVRLFNETKEALERQTATAEILSVIASSPSDVQPVFDTIAASALRLCDGSFSVVSRYDGRQIDLAAFSNLLPEHEDTIRGLWPMQPGRGSATARAISEGQVVQIPDALEDREYQIGSAAEVVKFRAVLAVPMLRDGVPIGVINVNRQQPGFFPEHQVALLKTFADQAVIAIENVRLFTETREALERQTATAEILNVIASSPADVQPVFEAIAASARRLLDGGAALVARRVADMLHLAAYTSTSEAGDEVLQKLFPSRITGQGHLGQAVLSAGPIWVDDMQTDANYSEGFRAMARTRGLRSVVSVPMLREGEAIGVISVNRPVAGRFSEHQTNLLKTFASQAVIAIENVRLFNETKEALERQTATAEILAVIASSPSDVQPVFDAIAASALRLFGGHSATVTRLVGDTLHLAALTSTNEGGNEAAKSLFPRPLSAPGLHNTVARTGKPAYRSDSQNDPDVLLEFKEMARAQGFRSQLVVPMLRDGIAIGTIGVRRVEQGPFADHQFDLLKTFADQAVIAIQNVRLFNETKEALERQTATAEILKVISSSPTDTQPVFEAIVQSGLKLFPNAAVIVTVSDGNQGGLAAIADADPLHAAEWKKRHQFPLTREYMHAVAILDRMEVEVPDAQAYEGGPLAAGIRNFLATGNRAITIVPMLRPDVVIGTLSVIRRAPGPLTEKQFALLRTFADQAVIAIENVRLFNETREALERQTATAEILKVIASSPSDVQPVFDAILENACHLCDSQLAAVFRYDGAQLHLVATKNWSVEALATVASRFPTPPDPGMTSGQVILTGKVVCQEDTLADATYDKSTTQAGGWRRILGVPMTREGAPIGVIVVSWREPGRIPERQITLLKTFADQAVIAIENVRLFNETKEALERQTATAEILKVISSSPTNTQPVFDAIANSCLRLFSGMRVVLVLRRGDVIDRAAFAGAAEVQPSDDLWPLPLDDRVISGRAILRGELVHISDVDAESWVGTRSKEAARRVGYRGIICAPMMREGGAIGAINVARAAPGAFDDKRVALLKTFADQAVIAIENVRLFKELQAQTEALTRSVGQLTALGEVGQAISSTLDLETVLRTIVSRAVQLTGLDGGSIYEYDERAEEFHLRATENVDEEYLAVLRRTPIRKGEGAVGRAALTGEPVQIPDVQDGSYKSRLRDALIRAGYRAVLVVPLRREEHVIGALSVTRKTPGPFAPEIVELLKTFATQSAMAIQNARLFREIAEKGKQLEEASQHKSNFLASMSHELRTPLNAILGFNEMILDQVYGEVSPEVQAPLENIQASGKHLLRLINNVLDLAKIEAGRMELSLQDYSVHDAVASVQSILRPLAAEKGLEFLATLPDDLPLAYGDSGRIAQCLMNLAGNSIKFTKAGKVEILAVEKDGLLTFRVTDTGVGIPPDKIDSLFTEFKQTDATIASEYGGTGLGLSISKKFVEMHGGRIWVESELGKGSAFIIEIPLRVKTP